MLSESLISSNRISPLQNLQLVERLREVLGSISKGRSAYYLFNLLLGGVSPRAILSHHDLKLTYRLSSVRVSASHVNCSDKVDMWTILQ